MIGSAVDLILPGVPSRFGSREVSVVLMPSQPDGLMTWGGVTYLFIGTRPLPLMEEVGREARRIVRSGLRDVLDWLGESWYDEPTGVEIFEALKHGANPRTIVNRHVSAVGN